MNTIDALLVVGGYGIVGQQVAECIRERYPDLPLIIAGRNPAKGEPVASKLTNAETAMLDVEQPEPLKGIRPAAMISVVNDPGDYLFMEAAQKGIPYLDIARVLHLSAARFSITLAAARATRLSSMWLDKLRMVNQEPSRRPLLIPWGRRI